MVDVLPILTSVWVYGNLRGFVAGYNPDTRLYRVQLLHCIKEWGYFGRSQLTVIE